MRGTFIALAATATFVALPAAAQSAADIKINGVIPASCSALTLAKTTVSITTFESTAPGDVGKLSTAFSGSSGIAVTGTTSKVTCNSTGTKIEVDAEPMVLPGDWGDALTNGFTNTVNYTATVTATGYAESTKGAGVIATNATTDDKSNVTVGLLDSALNISVSNASASGTLIAGTYTGSIGITLTPPA